MFDGQLELEPRDYIVVKGVKLSDRIFIYKRDICSLVSLLMNESFLFFFEQKRLKAAEAESKLKQVYIPT